jgi:DNA transformation protein
VHLLRNLGPRSAAMLVQAGIATIGDLRALGAAEAWRRVRFMEPGASRNLFWALAAGLQDRDWRSLTPAEKRALEEAARG